MVIYLRSSLTISPLCPIIEVRDRGTVMSRVVGRAIESDSGPVSLEGLASPPTTKGGFLFVVAQDMALIGQVACSFHFAAHSYRCMSSDRRASIADE